MGSTPTSITFDPVVQRLRHLRDMQETMVQLHPGSLADLTDGHPPSKRVTPAVRLARGLMVQWEDIALARR